MTRVVKLRDPMVRPTTPQCSATVTLSEFAMHSGYAEDRAQKMRAKGLDPTLCSHSSSYTIDGTPFCTRHAGMKALDLVATPL